MNFYEHQDRAERRTKVIVLLFVLAVLCIVAIVGVPIGFATEWNPVAVGATALTCLLVVCIATFVKLSQLRGGGESVAVMLGGTALQRNDSDSAEQRVQNVVEEMAIASGMPVPTVYLIEDDGINAFAAGWNPDDAVIGVTRGCIEQLNRDELQGVIAHEFSHISHGDMRINIRLIGIIFGIMVLGITGWILVRYVGPAILRSSSRSRSKEGAGGAGIGLAVIVFGLFLALCGAIGTFFGRLIQAAVSRQREFLADASAVQFTRNPLGIGGALRKIGGMKPLNHASAEAGQCNHMFFSQAMRAVFASHPPIAERVARVEGIDADSLKSDYQEGCDVQTQQVGFSGRSGVLVSSVNNSVENRFGCGGEHLQRAKEAILRIDPTVKDALMSGWSARLVLFALVAEQNQQTEQMMAKVLSVEELAELRVLLPLVKACEPETRLPIIDLAAPAIRSLSQKQLIAFNNNLVEVINIDGVVDRFEWVMVSVLQKHLSVILGNKKIKIKNALLSSYGSDVSCVIAALAYCGADSQEGAKLSFQRAVTSLGFNIQMPDIKTCVMKHVSDALKNLQSLRFVDRGVFIGACELCVAHDKTITVVEAETIRAIGDILDCPIPMFA